MCSTDCLDQHVDTEECFVMSVILADRPDPIVDNLDDPNIIYAAIGVVRMLLKKNKNEDNTLQQVLFILVKHVI